MGYKLGYHILVLPNQVLLINSVLTNEVLLYMYLFIRPIKGPSNCALCRQVVLVHRCSSVAEDAYLYGQPAIGLCRQVVLVHRCSSVAEDAYVYGQPVIGLYRQVVLVHRCSSVTEDAYLYGQPAIGLCRQVVLVHRVHFMYHTI